jgi:Holliday junction resolvase
MEESREIVKGEENARKAGKRRKRSGTRFEYRCCDEFRRKGFGAVRFKCSWGAYDLLLYRGESVCWAVACRRASGEKVEFSREEIEKLIKSAKELGCEPLLAYGFHHSPVYVLEVREPRAFTLRRGDGTPLEVWE